MGLFPVDLAQGDQALAPIGFFDANFRLIVFAQHLGHRDCSIAGGAPELAAVAVARILVFVVDMQEGRMRWIDANLQRLQPVAFPQTLEGEDVAVRCDKAVEVGKGRRLARAKIGPQDARLGHHRIGAL